MRTLGCSHNPAIDGMRALAVLAVIVFHVDAPLLPGGFTGVDLFFVISGFVISQSLAARGDTPPGTLLLDFYRRRVLRLLPALLLMLVVTFVLSALLIPRAWRNEQFDQTGMAALLGLSNIVLAGQQDSYFSPGADLNPFLHTWTLGVEEQFYLVFPVLFIAWMRGRQRFPSLRWLLPVVSLVSLVLAAWQSRVAPTTAFYLLPARFWELAAGALLYQWMTARGGAPRGRWLAWPGGALLGAGVVLAPSLPLPFPGVALTVIGALLLLAAVSAEGAATTGYARLLSWGPLTYLGRISYSLYLWHWPLLVLLRWTYGLQGAALWLYPILLLLVASASYRWVEVPLRRAPALAAKAPAKVLAMAVPVVAGAALLAWSMVNFHEQISLSSTRDGYAWQARKYPAWRPLDPVDAPGLAGRRLFVAGDSHAAAYRTLTSMVARQTGMEVRQDDQGGCGIVNLLRAAPADCRSFAERALSRIEAQARPGDIVLLASLRMPELRGRDWGNGDAVVFQQMLAERTPSDAAAARAEAERVLDRLQRLGVHVVVDAPLPLFKAGAYRCTDRFNRMNPACAGGLDMARADLELLRAPQLELLAALSDRYPSLHVWDPLPLLCGAQTCSAMDGDQPLFFDNDHLSGHGNRVLLPDFRTTLIDITQRAPRTVEPGSARLP